MMHEAVVCHQQAMLLLLLLCAVAVVECTTAGTEQAERTALLKHLLDRCE
jgi:hypothetical protein